MVNKYVYGTYPTVVEAEEAVAHIINQGVPRDSVTVVGSNAHDYNGEADFITYGELVDEEHDDNRGFFARLFGLGDDYDDNAFDNIDFAQYEDSLSRDELLLLVDQDYESQLTSLNLDNDRVTTAYVDDEVPVDRTYDDVNLEDNDYDAHIVGTETHIDAENQYDYDEVNTPDNDYDTHIVGEETRLDTEDDYPRDKMFTDDEVETDRIRLHEEEIDAHVRKKDVGDVTITKEVVEETQTIEVPVEREEIRIHHNRPTDDTADSYDDAAFVEEDIVIPVSEEEVVVDKNVVVTDEVEIEKVTHTDTETVTETSRREELDINDNSDRVIEEDDDRDINYDEDKLL